MVIILAKIDFISNKDILRNLKHCTITIREKVIIIDCFYFNGNSMFHPNHMHISRPRQNNCKVTGSSFQTQRWVRSFFFFMRWFGPSIYSSPTKISGILRTPEKYLKFWQPKNYPLFCTLKCIEMTTKYSSIL